MEIKKYHLVLCFAFLFAISVSMVVASMPVAATSAEITEVEKEEVNVPADIEENPSVSGVSGGLKPGDIIVMDSGGKIGYIIPGKWTHTQMVIHHDPNRIIEADQHGVHKDKPDNGKVLRVRCKSSTKRAAVQFAKAQLGKGYDYTWWTKAVRGSRYYCSELVWAAYKANGVELDKNPGFHWKYLNGVAPQEIHDDYSTYCVGWVTWR
jgi:hypothetical protein